MMRRGCGRGLRHAGCAGGDARAPGPGVHLAGPLRRHGGSGAGGTVPRRGRATFVEADGWTARRVLGRNLAAVGAEDAADVHVARVEDFLKRSGRRTRNDPTTSSPSARPTSWWTTRSCMSCWASRPSCMRCASGDLEGFWYVGGLRGDGWCGWHVIAAPHLAGST